MEDRGIINYDNGDIYTGQIKNFKKHGFGELSFANGNGILGIFRQVTLQAKESTTKVKIY